METDTLTRLLDPDQDPGAEPASHSGLDRTPPVNFEAEQALIGAILANNAALEKVTDFLSGQHFADPVHARIYEACAELVERGQIANAVTLRHLFDRSEELQEVGGARYLAELQGNYVSIINARDYGRTIHDLYLRRQLVTLGEDMVNEAFEHSLEQDARQQIEGHEQRLYSLAESSQTEGGFKSFKSAVTEAIVMAEAAYQRDGKVAGVATGFTDIDRLLGGLHKSDLVILAGRPSMGKTALATNIAYNAAREERDGEGQLVKPAETIAFFSLEMSAEQLAARVIAERAEVRSDALRKGDMSEEEFQRIVEASRELHQLPLFIDDTPAISVAQLRTRARRLKRQQGGLALIVVDYLQLMQPSGQSRPENRVQEVSEITRGLKAIAKSLDVPVLALSQLSRAVEQREDKRPQLADLRESGSIEQDADVVMFVFREQYYAEREMPTERQNEDEMRYHERVERWKERCERVYGLAEVIVAKQRHGPIGTRKLHFNGDTTRFSDYLPEDYLPERS